MNTFYELGKRSTMKNHPNRLVILSVAKNLLQLSFFDKQNTLTSIYFLDPEINSRLQFGMFE